MFMLSNSYLIFGPGGPTDIEAAAITQRQTIPLIWAFIAGAPGTRFVQADEEYYFETTVAEAISVLNRGINAWSYNRYFSDTLAPFVVFRDWLATRPGETPVYINVTELIDRSPSPSTDIESLTRLPERLSEALANIERKEFTHFVNDIRQLSHPFITVPITGDRDRDIEILNWEIRDTSSPEAELALQLVGVDRNKSLLRAAVESVKLRRDSHGAEVTRRSPDDGATGGTNAAPTVYATDPQALRGILEQAGFSVVKASRDSLVLEANGVRLRMLRIISPHPVADTEEV